MITTDELAQNLAKYFITAPYKEYAINHIIIEINSLQYEASKQLVQFDLKATIVQLIEANITKDARCLNAFQQLKPTLLRKLQEKINYEVKEDKIDILKSYLKQFKWATLFNYRS